MRPISGCAATLGLFPLLLLFGCGSYVAHPRSDPNMITQEQMEQGHFRTAYEVVEALHSNWLVVKPTTLLVKAEGPDAADQVVVFYDENRLGGVDELRSILTQNIVYIRHLNGVMATQRWGVGYPNGVILVSSHAP